MTWQDVLTAIREGKTSIRAAPNGVPLVAINAPFYELMELMAALTTGYNAMVARAAEDQQRIERLRKMAQAAFPGDKVAQADGWISVDDMLPPKSGFYLTWDANVPSLGVYGYDYSAKNRAFNARDNDNGEHAIRVTHWFPTPAAPAVTGKEDN